MRHILTSKMQKTKRKLREGVLVSDADVMPRSPACCHHHNA